MLSLVISDLRRLSIDLQIVESGARPDNRHENKENRSESFRIVQSRSESFRVVQKEQRIKIYFLPFSPAVNIIDNCLPYLLLLDTVRPSDIQGSDRRLTMPVSLANGR